MSDLLVRLYALPPAPAAVDGVRIERVLPPDTGKVLEFVRTQFSEDWACECAAALYQSPPACFVAVQGHTLVGFACYDATAKGMFGPVGVSPSVRGQGIGGLLTYRCMEALREAGYAYAVIGWADGKESFYARAVGATPIADAQPNVYSRLI